MPKLEYDFLNYTSFPSSLKVVNELGYSTYASYFGFKQPVISVSPGAKLTIQCRLKPLNLAPPGASVPPQGNVGYSFISIFFEDAGKKQEWWAGQVYGTTDWQSLNETMRIPDWCKKIRVDPVFGGSGKKDELSYTWFDDLKIFQDDVLIYSDDFSNWNPIIGAGIGAPVGGVAGYLLKEPLGPMVSEVVGAVVGGALGGGVGLLTGLGIIPVPQIPALGAAPEGPGAPMRLGKYQITG